MGAAEQPLDSTHCRMQMPTVRAATRLRHASNHSPQAGAIVLRPAPWVGEHIAVGQVKLGLGTDVDTVRVCLLRGQNGCAWSSQASHATRIRAECASRDACFQR